MVNPFTAASCAAALTGLKTYSLTTNPFTFNTDKNVTANFSVKVPEQLRGLLGGQSGSILDVYGKGEYEWDKFRVNLWTNRGANNGVTIRYGKNLTELEATSEMDTVYTGIVPYYYNEETGELVMTNDKVEWSAHRGDFSYDLVKPVDMSGRWSETAPTKAQLKAAATAYLSSNEGWTLSENLNVSFVALADTEEYKNVSALQRVNLCDTVTIIHEGLGVSATAKVIRTEYDVLLERYNEIELGTASVSLGQAIEERILEDVPTTSDMQQAIANGTALITGNSGGYVVLKRNANGQPEELLIMDTPDILTAQNVWRFNNSGLGFSSTGYGGTYSTAWTIDGTFYANWITAGTMSANRVRTGTLQSYDGKVQIVLGNSNTAGKLIITSGNLQLDSAGNLKITGEVNATSGKIGGTNGLTILNGKGFYSGTKSSLTSGSNGIYVGTDGLSMGSAGGNFPLMWFDNATGAVKCFRLDFIMESGNTFVSAHAIQVDDAKRLFTGGGWNIGGNGAYNPPGGEYDTCIYNTLYYGNSQQMSDRNIKHDIEELPLDTAKNFVMGLRPVSYIFNEDVDNSQKTHHGMIAQEVREVVQDKWGVVGGSEDTTLCLNYTEMIADLVKVVQDQEKRIQALEEALNAHTDD